MNYSPVILKAQEEIFLKNHLHRGKMSFGLEFRRPPLDRGLVNASPRRKFKL